MQNEICLAKNEAYVGKVVEVLCEGSSKTDATVLTGRTTGNKIVLWPKIKENIAIGDLIQVKITQAQTWLLKGEQIC